MILLDDKEINKLPRNGVYYGVAPTPIDTAIAQAKKILIELQGIYADEWNDKLGEFIKELQDEVS